MITTKKIKYINDKLKYEDLITDIYDIHWLSRYINILSKNSQELFNLFINNLSYIKNLYVISNTQVSINDIIYDNPSDINKFKEIFYSDEFKYQFDKCIEILNFFIDKIVDIDINDAIKNNNTLHINSFYSMFIDSKFETSVNTIYRIFSKIFSLCIIDKKYKKITENLIIHILDLYTEKLKNESYTIYNRIIFFTNFGMYFNIKTINLENTYSIIENGISSNIIESLFNKYKDILLNCENFKNTVSQNFIFTEEFVENHLQYISLNQLCENIAKIRLVKNSRIDENNKKIDTIVSYPISLDFYDKYQTKLLPFNDFVFNYINSKNISLVAFSLKYKQNNLSLKYFLDSQFIYDAIKKYESSGFCTIFFKYINKDSTYKNERIVYWEKLLNNIFFSDNVLSFIKNDLIKSHINWVNIFENKIIYNDTIETIIDYGIKSLFSQNELDILSKNFIYSDKLLEKIIPYLNLKNLVNSKFLTKKQLKVINKYLNEIKGLISNGKVLN